MNKKSKESKPRVELQQLSPRDIQRREAPYRKDLGSFRAGLIAGERFKRNAIKKLARDLEEAGTIEVHKISSRIVSDLRDLISSSYPSMVLEEKYKIPHKEYKEYKDWKSPSDKEPKIENSIFDEGTTTTVPQSEPATSPTQDITEEVREPPAPAPEAQAVEESRPSPQTIQEERAHDTFVDNLYHHTRNLIEMLTGYREDKILNSNDNLKLVSDTRQYRFFFVMRLAELDAKTIYKDVRTVSLLLDDLLKQLDNNLDARKKKQALTSE
jgi:hypothetical protein